MGDTLKNKAYKYIRDKIINGEYEPGYFLDEKLLIAELNASRTPIREALNKIEQEKLIQILPKRGVVVSQITFKNIMDVYQLREVIEPPALAVYGHNLNKERLNEFKEGFSEQKNTQHAQYGLDDEFHAYILGAYNNEYIANIMDELRAQNQRIRVMSGKASDCSEHARNEHLAIIDSLLCGDYIKAGEFLKEHIVSSRTRTLNILA